MPKEQCERWGIAHAQKTPLYLEKVPRLRPREGRLHVEETLENESDVSLRAVWGHHPAFGRPFLEEGCRVKPPEGTTVVHRLRAYKNHTWPLAEGQSGEDVDPGVLPARETLSEMLRRTEVLEGDHAREVGAR